MNWRSTTRTAFVFAALAYAFPAQQAPAPVNWPLWQSYVGRFFDPQGRFVEHSAGDRTTSEAQAYGMFFALVANDRDRFDRTLGWTESNLAQGGLSKSLPAWLWGENSQGGWSILDQNSASDADLWMSYSLLQAGRLWKERRYSDLGAALARLIEQREVADLPGLGPMLLPGAAGFHEQDEFILNQSYVPLQVVQGIAAEMPNSGWTKVSAVVPVFLEKSSFNGFAMDWVAYENDKFAPARGPASTPSGSYDAIRVYLWAGMLADDSLSREVILQSFPGMGDYLRKHDFPPERVSPDGHALGGRGPVGFSAAILPYLLARSEAHPADKQRARLTASLNNGTGLYGDNPTYYDQNLALFATGWSEGRFRFAKNGQLQVAWSKP